MSDRTKEALVDEARDLLRAYYKVSEAQVMTRAALSEFIQRNSIDNPHFDAVNAVERWIVKSTFVG